MLQRRWLASKRGAIAGKRARVIPVRAPASSTYSGKFFGKRAKSAKRSKGSVSRRNKCERSPIGADWRFAARE